MNILKQISGLILRPSANLGTLTMPLYEPTAATERATFGMS